MISERLSEKFRTCSLLATLFVVYRHSFVIHAFYGTNTCDNQELMFFTHWISNLTEVAVPIFFIISGFFFLGKNYYSDTKYGSMLQKKAKTLLVPFVFWNIIGLLVLFLYRSSDIPHDLHPFMKRFFSSDFNGPLWYVRDIMLYMLLVPLYQWIFYKRMSVFCGVFVVYLFARWLPVDCAILSTEGVLFFILGGILGKYKMLDKQIGKKWVAWALFILWQACCLFCDVWANEWIHKTIVILGVLSVWYGIDLIPSKFRMKMKQISCYAFFVYVTHFYCVKIVKVIVAHWFYGNGTIALLTFLLVPVIVVSCLLKIGMLYKAYLPKVYLFTTGNR